MVCDRAVDCGGCDFDLLSAGVDAVECSAKVVAKNVAARRDENVCKRRMQGSVAGAAAMWPHNIAECDNFDSGIYIYRYWLKIVYKDWLKIAYGRWHTISSAPHF
jgi:hypothetical protein